MKKLLLPIMLSGIPILLNAQQPFGREPLAHTYSIVAIDPETGEMGAAVQSHWFSVGTLVIWGEPGVGVVATQSFVNPAYGPEGLQLMSMGFNPEQAIKMLTEKDSGEEYRQVGMLNADGEVAAFTGESCIEAAGHYVGDGYAVQANLMEKATVWPAMAKAFEASKGQPLAERLVAALEAAQAEGGDIRGKQSAALIVVSGERTDKAWEGRPVSLRVDDHPNPVQELKRLLKVHRAYEHMNRGDLAVEEGDMNKAREEYGAAEAMFPDNLEMKYWHAIALANEGELEAALPMFEELFRKGPNWKVLTPRLVKNGLLTVEAKELARIMEMGE
ncbi:MAG: DUF1028 domain-containing protein [Phaeodactylibacter sp.]|nr:DUF1028 domain-containing protein [Phaeodactylibacter sp.]MCB9289053.1 DUF1028 domain-containing protein [Lewinellaceae bacterium]